METLTKNEFCLDLERYCLLIRKKNTIFIYPTDTIYGIGCDATNDEAVSKIRDIKERYTRPFSVIAPSINWILENCEVKDIDKNYLDKLPGPYTIILNLKNKNCISPNVNNNADTIGVRIPDHWISDCASKIGRPIVTTSANKMGKNFMTSLDDLDKEIKSKVDFIVNEGEKKGRPSEVINLTGVDVEVTKR